VAAAAEAAGGAGGRVAGQPRRLRRHRLRAQPRWDQPPGRPAHATPARDPRAWVSAPPPAANRRRSSPGGRPRGAGRGGERGGGAPRLLAFPAAAARPGPGPAAMRRPSRADNEPAPLTCDPMGRGRGRAPWPRTGAGDRATAGERCVRTGPTCALARADRSARPSVRPSVRPARAPAPLQPRGPRRPRAPRPRTLTPPPARARPPLIGPRRSLAAATAPAPPPPPAPPPRSAGSALRAGGGRSAAGAPAAPPVAVGQRKCWLELAGHCGKPSPLGCRALGRRVVGSPGPASVPRGWRAAGDHLMGETGWAKAPQPGGDGAPRVAHVPVPGDVQVPGSWLSPNAASRRGARVSQTSRLPFAPRRLRGLRAARRKGAPGAQGRGAQSGLGTARPRHRGTSAHPRKGTLWGEGHWAMPTTEAWV
jgi:hypothetical protein